MLLRCAAGEESLARRSGHPARPLVLRDRAECEASGSGAWCWGVGQPPLPSTDADQAPVPADRFLAVEARWPARSVLVVEARETGLQLDEVQLVGDLPLSRRRGTAPRSISILGSCSTSSVALRSRWPAWAPAIRSELTLFARSPGYAWGRIEIDLSIGGERLLTLAPWWRPAGVVPRTVPSARTHCSASVARRIETGSGAPAPGRERRRGRVPRAGPLSGLGPDRAVVREPDRAGHRTTWTSSPVAWSSVILTWAMAPAVQVGSLSGKVVIPRDGTPRSPFLSFSLEEKALGGMAGILSLNESELTRTRISRRSTNGGCPRSRRVAGRSSSTVRLGDDRRRPAGKGLGSRHRSSSSCAGPPAGPGERNRSRGRLDRVFWRSHVPGSSGGVVHQMSGGTPRPAFSSSRRPWARSRCRPGGEGEYERLEKTFEIHEGLNELTTEVQTIHRRRGHPQGRLDDRSVELRLECLPRAHRRGSRVEGGTGYAPQGVRLTVVSPGLYRIALPEIDGYLPVRRSRSSSRRVRIGRSRSR